MVFFVLCLFFLRKLIVVCSCLEQLPLSVVFLLSMECSNVELTRFSCDHSWSPTSHANYVSLITFSADASRSWFSNRDDTTGVPEIWSRFTMMLSIFLRSIL